MQLNTTNTSNQQTLINVNSLSTTVTSVVENESSVVAEVENNEPTETAAKSLVNNELEAEVQNRLSTVPESDAPISDDAPELEGKENNPTNCNDDSRVPSVTTTPATTKEADVLDTAHITNSIEHDESNNIETNSNIVVNSETEKILGSPVNSAPAVEDPATAVVTSLKKVLYFIIYYISNTEGHSNCHAFKDSFGLLL